MTSLSEITWHFLWLVLTDAPLANLAPYSLNPSTFSGYIPFIEYQPAVAIILLSSKIVL